MHVSHSSLAGAVAGTGHRGLIASLCLSLALHGLLAFVHPASPTGSLQTAPSGLPTTGLKVELLPSRQAHPLLFAVEKAVPETLVPSQARSRRANTKSNRQLTNDDQAPSRAGISGASSNTGATSVSPSIDLDAARASARQTARAQSAPMTKTTRDAPDAAEPETVLGRKISRAAHPDCRTSYAGAGLLAIPLLLKDAVSAGGCTW